MQALKPGVDLMNLSEKCIKEAEKCTVVDVTWDIYNCTITNALKGKPLSIDNFAEIMTKNYPPSVASSIKNLVSSKSHSFGTIIEDNLKDSGAVENSKLAPDDKNYDATLDVLWKHRKLIAIRNAYYEIEKEACEAPSTPSRNKANDVAPDKCYSWMEEVYRLGGCCNGVPIPLPLVANPYIPTVEVANFTKENIMPIAGKYVGTNLTHSYNLKLCYATSYLMLTNQLKLDMLMKEVNDSQLPDYEKLAESLIPNYYNEELKDEMKSFMTFDLIDNGNYSEFIHFFNTSESYWLKLNEKEEFVSFHNSNKTRYLFWHCAAHKVLARRTKDFDITPWCGNPLKEPYVDVEDYTNKKNYQEFSNKYKPNNKGF